MISIMTSIIWYIILVKTILCSESESNSDSLSDSSDSKEGATVFDGEYTSADFPRIPGISICTAENGHIYVTGGPITGDAITSYINTYGRSTEGVLEVSHGVYQANFDVFQFDEPNIGVNRIQATIKYIESTNSITLSFDEGPASILTKTSHKATRCLIPDGNWYSVNEDRPIVVASDAFTSEGPICGNYGVSNCVVIMRFENALVDGRSCWGIEDIDDNNKYVSGGDISITTQVVWDGWLRIIEWDDKNPSAPCTRGNCFKVWTDGEEEVVASYNCPFIDAGFMYPFNTITHNKTCPLYVATSGADTMFRNDDEYNENGHKVETIVIIFSNATISMLW
eukprot:271550_1